MDEESNLFKATVVLSSEDRTWTQEVWFQNSYSELLCPVIKLPDDKDFHKVCTRVILILEKDSRDVFYCERAKVMGLY